ncbi:MAG: hypothetical protein R3F56_17500 [Planctomycetota bacterium]
MNPFRLQRSLAALLAALASPLLGQSLSADVVRNSDDTVTYSFDIAGPPGGIGFVFVTPHLLPAPLPTPYGPLFLDPVSMVSLGNVALDPAGQGRLQLRVPMATVNGLCVCAQALVLDSRLTPRLTLDWGGALREESPRDDPESLAWSTGGGDLVRVQFQGQSQFHSIKFRDASGQILGECTLQRGPNGMTQVREFRLSRPLRADDTYETWESDDGEAWTLNRQARRVGG